MFVVIDNLLVGKCRLALRIPVDHAEAAIDEAFLIEIDEDVDDSSRTGFIHCKSRTVPVAGTTEFTELFENDSTMFIGPGPCMLKELLAGEVALVDTLFLEALDDLGLRGDGCMVGTGYPAGVLALHTGTAHQNILDGLIEYMSHVEHTRHIRRGNHNRVGLTSVGSGSKYLMFSPILIPFVLHFGRIIFCC